MFIKGQAGQVVNAQMLNASTGAPFVGAVTVNVTIDNGAQAVGLGAVTAKGTGQFQYAGTAADWAGDNIAFQFVGTGAIDVVINAPTITAAQAGGIASATGALAVVVSTILADAFVELNIYGASELPSPEDQAYALGKLNRLLDNWNAERDAVYCEVFSSFTLTPSLSPHTIGPTGTFVTTQRPVKIEDIDLVISGVHYPVNVRDAQWYSALAFPSLTSTIPTDCYYEEDWPNGKLFFWPVPTSAYSVTLMSRVVLGQVLATDTFWLPPGYRDAVTLTLAEDLAPAFPNSVVSPSLMQKAVRARARIFANNVTVPRLQTRDSGMPAGRGRGWFNFRTGQIQ